MVGWALGPATILECAGLLIWFSGTIKTQNFPFLFYAFRIVARSGLMFLHNLVALAVIFSLFGHVPIMNLTLIPAVLLMLLLSVPYSLLIGMLCARYRDIQVFVGNFASVLFVVTPIIWTPSNAPGARSAAYVAYNPFFYLVDLIREPLQNHFAPIQDWVVCGGVAAAGWALCFLCLSVFRSRIAFWV
jgi:lipopolysaccharide transport system permease protein